MDAGSAAQNLEALKLDLSACHVRAADLSRRPALCSLRIVIKGEEPNGSGTVWNSSPMRPPQPLSKMLRMTPAMGSGTTEHAWTIEQMLDKVGL